MVLWEKSSGHGQGSRVIGICLKDKRIEFFTQGIVRKTANLPERCPVSNMASEEYSSHSMRYLDERLRKISQTHWLAWGKMAGKSN